MGMRRLLLLTGYLLVSLSITTAVADKKPTLIYGAAQPLHLADGSNLTYPHSASVSLHDLNRDEKVDLVVASEGCVYAHLQNEDGTFDSQRPLESTTGPIDTGVKGVRKTSIAFADINGDGDADLLLTENLQLNYYPQSGKSDGIPTFGHKIPLGRLDSNRFDVRDWNGDGLLDVVTGNFYGGLMYYLNAGTNTNPVLADGALYPNWTPGAYTPWPRLFDFNGDGTDEVLYTINWGYITIGFGNPDGTYKVYRLKHDDGTDVNIRSHGEHQCPTLADVDGDGVMDIVTSGDKTGTGDILFFHGIDAVTDAQLGIESLLLDFPDDLNKAMDEDPEIYDLMYNKHRVLQEYVNNPIFPDHVKQSIYDWYIDIIAMHPQYYARQSWDTPGAAQHAAYVWMVVLESRPNTPDHRQLLSDVTLHSGYAARLLVDRGLLLLNNDAEDEGKLKLIYDFMMIKDPELYSLGLLSQRSHLKGKGMKYGHIRESAANIFSSYYSWGENSFPPDCQVCKEEGRDPFVMIFVVALAHEVAHNELDQSLADNYNFTLFKRKFEILRRGSEGHVVWKTPVHHGYDWKATQALFQKNNWWDGVADWDATFRDHFDTGPGQDLDKNVLRPIGIDFFIQRPQEAFATLANLYFSDTKLMLDFALERTKAGYPACMDWFFLIADYYTKGGQDFPLVAIDSKGNIKTYGATLTRNSEGYVDGVHVDGSLGLPGPSDYNCDVDEAGFVVSCVAS